jgi:hypothetical protein
VVNIWIALQGTFLKISFSNLHFKPIKTLICCIMQQNEMNQMPSFKEALKFWVKLGFISFGGPAGQIAIMHEFLVDKKKWISDSKFLHALNYCMVLPGPEAQQLATYIGWMLHGRLGGLAAGIFFCAAFYVYTAWIERDLRDFWRYSLDLCAL